MTEEQRKNLFSRFTEITQIKEEEETIDTILPQSIETPRESISDTSRDESKLTYEELIEDFITYEKPAIMSLKTFERLWNS